MQTLDLIAESKQTEQESKELFSDPMGELNIDFSTYRKKSKFFDKRVAFNMKDDGDHLNTSFDRQNSTKTIGESTGIPLANQSGGSTVFNFKTNKDSSTTPKRQSGYMTLKQRESVLRGKKYMYLNKFIFIKKLAF